MKGIIRIELFVAKVRVSKLTVLYRRSNIVKEQSCRISADDCAVTAYFCKNMLQDIEQGFFHPGTKGNLVNYGLFGGVVG